MSDRYGPDLLDNIASLPSEQSGSGHYDSYGRGWSRGGGFGTGSGCGYGYGSESGDGSGCRQPNRNNGSMLRLGSVGHYTVWLDTAFGYASVGCQSLTIAEWRAAWKGLAADEHFEVSEYRAEELLQKAEQLIAAQRADGS